jgi:hypothetical protein
VRPEFFRSLKLSERELFAGLIEPTECKAATLFALNADNLTRSAFITPKTYVFICRFRRAVEKGCSDEARFTRQLQHGAN